MSLPRGAIGCAVLALTFILLGAASARAQGYPGGGMGRRGEGRSQEHHEAEDPSAAIGKRFEEMAATKPVLKDVKLDRAQKDSIGRIEKTYQNRFLSYSIAVRHLFEEAKAQGSSPDADQLQQLHEDARKLQDQEYGELRAVIAEDQRARFDANVQQSRSDDDRGYPQRRQRAP
jgi:hypothetical protein